MDVRHFEFLVRQPSARLVARERFWGMPKRGIALILVNALFWQPIWAQAEGIAVSGGTNTSLSQAGNGVPIVNIAAPNATGLSHNQYQQYNVGSEGVILNNATGRTQNTQLGGIIVGNPNLKGSAASTILNEVVGANPSQLKGYTEVAGQGARVIVANPYGVTCNGCGFINTPRATLTTGTPVLDNGRLDRFQVDGGQVTVEGQGLDATGVDQFEIITRAAQINAQINAKQLTVIAGRNSVDAQSLNATAQADDGSSKPTLAIDSSALGGMYAGAIKLVGTEAGVGVKLAGNLAASAGDIQIDANGQLTVGQVAATGTAQVNAASADLQGKVYAAQVDIHARGPLNVQQNVAAQNSLTLTSDGQLTNNAIVEAGVNADNSRNATGDATLTAQNLRNTGSITASRSLTARVGQTLDNHGGTLNGQASTQLNAGRLDNRGGRILGQGELTLTADELDNRDGGQVTSAGNLRLNAGRLDNQGGSLTSTNSATINATGAVNNQGGEVAAGSTLTLTSASLDNSQQGRIAGAGVALTTGAFDNQQGGSLTSTGTLTLTAGQVNNSEAGRIASALALTARMTGLDQHNDGRLYGNGDVALDLNGGTLDNQAGLINAPGQLLLSNVGAVNNQGGEISSARAFTLAATRLQNTDGSVLSNQVLTLRVAEQLANVRGLISGTGLDLNAGELLNDNGALSSDSDLTLRTTGAVLNNNGAISAAGNATLSAGRLSNQNGQITADQRLSLVATGAVDNQAGTLGAGQGLALDAASLDNRQAGVVVTDGDLSATLGGTLDNRDGGSLQVKGPLSLISQQLDNRGGRVSTQHQLALRTGTTDNRGGLLRADQGLQLNADQFDNSEQGTVSSKAGIELTGQQLNNQQGLISAFGPLNLNVTQVLNGAGRIASQGDLTAAVTRLEQQGGELVAQGDLSLSGARLDNRAGGLVGATKALKLNVTEIDNRAGELSSQVGVSITGEQLDNGDGGKVLAGTALALAVQRVINQNKGLLHGDTLSLDGQQLDNGQGTLASQNGLVLNLSGTLDNTAGLVSSEALLTATAGDLNNAGGSFSSAAAMMLSATGALNNQGGSITTDAALTLTSASLDNRNAGLIAGKGASRVTTGAFDNSQGGRLTGSDTLTLTAGQVTNQAGRIASALALNANVTGLDQQGGQLFSNTALTLDLNNGLLNNQGGLINAPGALVLQQLGQVDNQNGEISSSNAFTLAAEGLDNSGGKLLSNQGLTLRIAQLLKNVQGAVAAHGLEITAADLNNRDGLLSSRDGLDLAVSNGLLNQQGAVIADGNLLLAAATLNNDLGQLSSKGNLTGQLGSLQQQGGQIIAQGRLSLTGNSLVNQANGLIAATEGVTLAATQVDNRGGEVSSQGSISLTAEQLDNSDNGKVLAQNTLALKVASLANRANGLLSGKAGLTLTGDQLDNNGGALASLAALNIDLAGLLDNTQGVISSEATLTAQAGRVVNAKGSLSSADVLSLTSLGAVDNSGGEIVTDAALTLHSASLNNNAKGSLSSKGTMALATGDFDNSQGRVSTSDQLNLTAAQLTNRDGGSIGSSRALVASVTGLSQENGQLFSNTSLSLDLNNGVLNNQGGLINAPGQLLLSNLAGVNNQGGEISSAQAFTLAAQQLNNSGGKLLSNQGLTLRIAQALNNVKGMIAAASLDASAASLDNSGGTLTSRSGLQLTVDGVLSNRDNGLINAAQALNVTAGSLSNQAGQLLGASALTLNAGSVDTTANGLINSQGSLNLTANSLDTSAGGEVSSLGDMTLALGALTQTGGRLLSDAGLALDLNGADLNNRTGLITAKGPLLLNRVGNLNNQGGEVSSSQGFTLATGTLDNSNGKLISNNQLTLNAATVINQNGLISGWQGLSLTSGTLDNRNNGTLSARNGNLAATLSGALLNSNGGALVSQQSLTLTAASLDNRGGILSSGAEQSLTTGGLLDNSQNGLIDSGAGLTLAAESLNNAAGNLSAQQAVSVTGTTLNNSGGNFSSQGAVTLDLLGALTNTSGKLASAGPLQLLRSSQVNNQGGQLVSQRLMTLNTGRLDNSSRGTVAANERLVIAASGEVVNSADGLIYSQNADLQLQAASLANTQGAVQSQGALAVNVSGDVGNLDGRLIAQNGDLAITANTLDSRGGVLSSLQGAFTARVTGVLQNGYDLNRQGGVIQAQRLDLLASAGLNNYGGRVSARAGDALVSASHFDNRNGGLYAKGLVRFTGNTFDNSGDNDGQIAGSQVDLTLSGALNNRFGVIESDTTLNITAASLDNQTGKIRALGSAGTTQFNIGGTFDNRSGTLETANSNLAFNVGNFLNTGGSLLHVGTGEFGISTANITNAGGSIVTRGGLTLNADSWTNTSVIQAGRLTVNVGTFTQTASGQLLAADSLVGTGGNWTNDGLIASDGSQNLNLSGSYGGNGRVSSLGNLTLSAAQLNLSNAASIAGGGSTGINVGGQLTNQGRLTSAADLTVSAGALNNYGTLGAGQGLTVNTPSLLNDHGLLFSGGDIQLNVGSFTNQTGDLYGLRNVTIGGYGAARANQVSNISGSMESGGQFSIAATAFENRTQGGGEGNNFAVGRTLISGFIAVQCIDCNKTHWEVNYIAREIYSAGEDSDTTASASLAVGGDFNFNGGNFLNSKSTVSAVGDISIKADNVKNIGALSGTIEHTRTYYEGGRYTGHEVDSGKIKNFARKVDAYNQRNNPEFPNVYYVNDAGELALAVAEVDYPVNEHQAGNNTQSFRDVKTGRYVGSVDYPVTVVGYSPGRAPTSKYDPNNLVQLPSELSSLKLMSDVEVAKDGSGNGGRSAVIQAGGKVSITATQDLQNSVIHEDYAVGGGTNKVQDTRASGAGAPIVLRINGQLPPNLAQQQINPLSLPGFSLPTGQNGLFRLSGQGSSAPQAAQANGAPQSWTIAGASVSLAQREQSLPDAVGRNVQFGSAAQMAASTGQLAGITRQNAGITGQATTLGQPVDGGFDNGGYQVPGHQANPGGMTVGGTVGPVNANGQPAAQAPMPATVAAAIAQTVSKVQGLPSVAAQPNSNKYLIETNPVLTDLKQFMSSDYLLSGLGYNPDQSAKRLGDGLYEQRLVQQAVTARTGQAFIDGQTSNEAQFKYLMNNAIASKQALNLSVGVGLTSEQVAALTHDIVWLESHEVNGENVLVPVVYLAQANGRLGPTGALIAGNDVTLIAGQNLDNVGTLKANNNLSATAGNDLVNSGLIQAGNRLDLLAGNSVVNKAGGIIAGRDVSVTALKGDVINERTVTGVDSTVRGQAHKDYADNAARIEAANDMSLSAGRDINNLGSVLQSGRDLSLNAGRDVNLAATQLTNSLIQDRKHTSSDITQVASTVTAGRDLSAQAGRDINVIASQLDAKRDLAMAATEDLTISSAADEQHSYSKSKKVTRQEDHVNQVASTLTSGGSVALSSGQDLTVTSSRIEAANEAYLVAGGDLALLAAQDSDYSLYSKKKKGHFGAKKTKRDEVTDVTNVGTEIKTGGDLLLVSGKDQTYQAAKLDSGNDLTLNSGGAIAFEGVKDLHQESHEKSNSNLAWNSAKGKGNTDETLKQSELVAQGEVAINAVNGLHIDVKQVNQQTVSQAIDAMVKADPQLAWLKDAEKRGDVDWRQVKEIHDSFKYSQSGLGVAAQLAIAIVIAYFTAGVASGLVASAAGAGGTAAGAAAGAATGAAVGGATSAATTASIWAAASTGVTAGWANVAATAALTSVASNAGISAINNRGNLAAVFRDTTSKDALKGYAAGAITAGLTAGLYDKWVGTQTGASTVPANSTAGVLANSGGVTGAPLNTWAGIGKFAANQALQNTTSVAVAKVLGQEGNLGDALRSSLASTFAAAGFNLVGNTGFKNQYAPGSPQMVGLHALMGGLAAVAAGGDFKAGALAGGASEALVKTLDNQFSGLSPEKRSNLLVLTTQLVGIAVAATVDNGDGKAVQTGAWVAKTGTQYNYLSDHQEQVKQQEKEACPDSSCRLGKDVKWAVISLQQDAGLALGFGGSLGLSVVETAEGIAGIFDHLEQIKAALSSPALYLELVKTLGKDYLSGLQQRVDLLDKAYNDAGWDGSITAGVEAGRLAIELVGVLTATKGSITVVGMLPKATEKLVNAVAKTSSVGKAGEPGRLVDLVSGETYNTGLGKAAANDGVFDGAKVFVPAERTGLNFEEKLTKKLDGYVEIELYARQKFDKSGAIVDSKYAQSDLVARYSPDGNLRVDWYGTTVSGKGVGTEMISRAIESVGADKVKTVSAQLGNTNLEVFRATKSTGLSSEQAVWSTPLGKTMKALGFEKVEVSGTDVKFL